MDKHLFELLNIYKRRFTATEKLAFLESAARIFSRHGLMCDIVHSSVLGWHTNALIVGNIDSAQTVVAARYDTPRLKLLPVPRYIGSAFGSFIGWFLPIACICALAAVIGMLLPYALLQSAIIAALLLFFCFAAFPCPNNATPSSGVMAAAMTAKAPDTAVILIDGSFFGLPKRKLLKKIKASQKTFITIRYANGAEPFIGTPHPELFSEGASTYKCRRIIIDVAHPASLGMCINNIGSFRDTELNMQSAAKAAETAVSIGRVYRSLI